MSLWSGESLAVKLPALVKPFDLARIDCAAYTLALGPEAYVTSDQRMEGSPTTGIKVELEPGGQFRIPPGQFAFLLTEEEVTVPNNAMALISIKATYKFKGLVNVSGFHVDPGWKGRLIFSVHNSGPASVILSRGAPAFLIWYIDLDQTSAYVKDGKPRFEQLPDALLNNMGGNVFSPMVLSQEVTELRESEADLREELVERANNLRIELAALKSDYEFHKRFFWIIISVLAVVAARPLVSSWFFSEGSRDSNVRSTTSIERRPANDRSADAPASTAIKDTSSGEKLKSSP
jgi:dCTP deaminase